MQKISAKILLTFFNIRSIIIREDSGVKSLEKED